MSSFIIGVFKNESNKRQVKIEVDLHKSSKKRQKPILTPMRSVGQTSEKPSVYAGFRRFALL